MDRHFTELEQAIISLYEEYANAKVSYDGGVYYIDFFDYDSVFYETKEGLISDALFVIEKWWREGSTEKEPTLTERINGELGAEVLRIENETNIIAEHGELDYTIVCDNEDDVHNTLTAMLNGIELLKEVQRKEQEC